MVELYDDWQSVGSVEIILFLIYNNSSIRII